MRLSSPDSLSPAALSRERRGRLHGYSLTELILSILIIAILAAMFFSFSTNKLRGKAERTGCESHLKTLYGGFSMYLIENGEWPQIPVEVEARLDQGPGEESLWEFWIAAIEPFGVVEKEWMCPTDLRELNANHKPDEREEFEGSYLPTQFGPGPEPPRAWRQPWLIERSNFHGEGNLLIMPDGSIEPWPYPAL